MPPNHDPAAVLGIAVSLYNGIDDLSADGNVSDAYDGGDEFMRQCMRVAELFETWACKHVDFERHDGVWPYTMEEKFCACYLKSFHWSELAEFGEHQCAVVAGNMGLVLLTDTPPSPDNPACIFP